MTLFFFTLLVISLVVFAFTHWQIKPRQKKPSIKPLLPSVISKKQLGLSEVNIGKINFGPQPAMEVKPEAPLPIQPAPMNQPDETIQQTQASWQTQPIQQNQPTPPTPPALLNEPAAPIQPTPPTPPAKPIQQEPPPNLPI